jgi:DNA repair photolyase
MSKFTEERDGHGTKEWSDRSYNICLGCEHACLYCYAKTQACWTKARLRKPGEWAKQTLNPRQARLGAEIGREGVIMFPTSHDITPSFLQESLTTIKNLLRHNKVLIVSKPHLSVIRILCRELKDRKADILFRFTIGSLDEALCSYWEPGAPTPRERISCLKYAFNRGFATSVSAEPMLDDCTGTIKLVDRVSPWVTDSIWLGTMSRIPWKHNAHVPNFVSAGQRIKSLQTDEQIMRLVQALKGRKQVRWKDSIKKVLARVRTSRSS